MERTVRIVLGDWSGDGHCNTETVHVNVGGEDVSDAALAASYTAMADQLGVDLSEIVNDYEDYSISAEYYEQILEAGFVSDLDPENYHSDEVIYVADVIDEKTGDEVEIGAVELVMFYVGSRIPGFTWSIQRNGAPLLLGGRRTILTQKNRHGKAELDDQGNNTTKFGYGTMS